MFLKRTKNLSDETDLGSSSCVNKYVKITNCNDTEANLIEGSQVSVSSKAKGKKHNLKPGIGLQETSDKAFQKQNSTNSLLKPITNFFYKFSSSNTLADSQLVNLSDTKFSESVNLIDNSSIQQNKLLVINLLIKLKFLF